MRWLSLLPRASATATALALSAVAGAQMDATFEQRLQHWSWQPLHRAEPPATTRADWVRDPLDAFVLHGLEQNGLAPADDAPPEVFLRRVHFDLTGLPPTPQQVEEFVRDPSPAARERVVDALLASPRFGERWARHWLDVVRYAETMGHEFDFGIPNAWHYRDYVIRALNADVPFDRFAIEHVAGDLLPTPRIDPETGTNESSIATGSFWFCEQTHSPVDAVQHQADRIDNQIDVLTKAFLGTTVACARCHDHKFDAIGADDYYALYGFLKSSRYVQRPVRLAEPAAVAAALRAREQLAGVAQEAPALDASLAGYTAIGDPGEVAAMRGGLVDTVREDTVVLRELPGAWLCTAEVSRSRDRVLMSPTFAPEGAFVHVRVAGQGARILLVVDGLHLVRDPIYGRLHRAIDDPEPHWVTFDLGQFRGRPSNLQFLDQRAHDLADAARDRRSYPDDAWIAVQRVVVSDQREPPKDDARSTRRELPLHEDATRQARDAWRAAVAALPRPGTAPGTADATGEDEHVFVRGDHKQKGAVVPRRFLRAIAGDAAMPVARGSGRLQLAERMFANDDPLPARVLANRLWHHLFGRGLARTVDNLGHLGEPPTDRALLDHLAAALQDGGWSQKALIRRLVLSRTYGMDSRATATAEERDADNRLWHRQNLRRLEGEALRDTMLFLADRLDERRYGPSVPIALSDRERARGRPEKSGPVDGDGRRSIYLAVARNFLPDFLVAFDLPRPFTTQGARSTANVPAQALALGNDPFVHGMARLFAEHLLQEGPVDEAAAVDRWFLACFARRATDEERALCRTFLARARRTTTSPDDAVSPFAELAHALWNKKEFSYLR